MMELLLVAAGVIIVVVFALYLRERAMLKRYSELLDEKVRIDKLNKQVQLDYYNRKLTEDTLRKILADYYQRSLEIEQTIREIEEKHGIKSKKSGLERHQERGASGKAEAQGEAK